MRTRLAWIVGFLALILAGSASARLEFERLSMDDGLAQSSIQGMLQDQHGFLWFGTQYGLSRYDGYLFKNFQHQLDRLDSLSDSSITDLTLGADGRLWVGTQSGLNRFDPVTGRSERFFLRDPEAVEPDATEVVRIIGETSEGRLFLRLAEAIAVLDPGSDGLERVRFETPLSELGLRRMAGLLDSEDRLWVLNDAGLWRLDEAAATLLRIEGVQPASPRYNRASLVETATGQVAALAEAGVMLIEPDSGRPGRLVRPAAYGMEVEQFEAVATTRDGSLWLVSDTNFYRYRPDRDEIEMIYQGRTRDLNEASVVRLQAAETGSDEVWFASQYGVSRWSEAQQELQTFLHDPRDDRSLPPTLFSAPYTLFVDADETLWIGSQLGGLARLPALSRRFDHLIDQSAPGSLPFAGQNVVRGVVESHADDEEMVWVALDSAGLRQYRREGDGEYQLVRIFHAEAPEAQRLPSNTVGALALDPVTRNLWVGLDQALVVIDTERGEVLRSNALAGRTDLGDIDTLLFSRDGERLWVGHAAVNEFHLGQDRLVLRDCPNGVHLSELGQHNLLELGDGRLVVAGDNGFSIVDFHGGREGLTLRERTFLTPGSREIFGLARHPGGGFWMGTRQSGLARVELDPGLSAPRMTWFDRSDGLIDDTIYAILPEPDGRLWMSSNRGLMRFDPASGDLRHFTPPDGVQHFEFNNTVAHHGASGHFYFGGINGLNAFRPENIRILEQAPRLRLTELLIDGRVQNGLLTTPTVIELGHDQNDLEVSFVGLHSGDPGRHRYQYWLEGLDEAWREPGFQRRVRYAGLRSGTYRLWARASNSDGIWSEDALLLEATVKPPPWATVWSLLAYVLGGLMLLFLFLFLARKREHQLEAEVQDRTRELTRQQNLIRSQARELERALQSRTEFFANVSHEFRTPLTLIQASLDDLGRRDPDAPPLTRARSYLDRLVRLVDQLLDLSGLQADRLREPVLPWSLSAMLGFMIRSFEPLASKRGIRFTSDLEPHCVTACSQHHVEQIALNLISNALKYSPRGAEVDVSLKAEEGGLALTVSDTGPGIDPSEHEAVFERFHRAQDARASGQDGAGIGLALVRETVEALGGSIELDSEPGRGSAFRVVLPGEPLPDLMVQAPAVDAKALDREVAQLSMLPAPPPSIPSENEDAEELLLLVEDQPEIRAHLADVLAEDWRVIEAADGQQGLERARQDQPDVIISDVMMPGMDGFQMLARLRDDLATSHIPVMLLTARHDRDSRMKGLMLSADDFMGKPFDVQELKVRLRRMRDNRKRLQRFLLDGGAPDLGQGEQESAPDLSARDRALLDSLHDWLEAHAEDVSVKVEDMAAAVALETRTLQRKIRALTGQTPSDFIRHFRLQRAIDLLIRTERSVNDIALSCGFSSPQSFSRVFSREYGQPPDRWRRTRGSTDPTSS